MARQSDPVGLRTYSLSFWQFKTFNKLKVFNFLHDFWIVQSFKKLFEKNREQITILTNIFTNYYYTYVHIILLIINTVYANYKKKILKRRIIFLLFKKKNFWNKQYKRQSYTKKNKNIKILQFITQENNRFKAYCTLKCKNTGKTLLNNMLKIQKKLKPTYINLQELPYKIKISNLFSLLDRSYIYTWRHFFTTIQNQLWSIKIMPYFMSTLKIFFSSLFLINAEILAEQFAYLLKKSRKHWSIIRTIKQILKIMNWFAPNYKNIRIQIKGPIQNSERTRLITLGSNNIILSTFKQAVTFSVKHATTAFGVLGIKIWILN